MGGGGGGGGGKGLFDTFMEYTCIPTILVISEL